MPLFTHDTHVRVRYAETDQMGFVYYGRYMEYLEVGRVEMMRARGIPYRLVEEKGIWMPVTDVQLKYRAPGRYDELLTIRTYIHEMPRATLDFGFEIFKEDGALCLEASVKLAFLDRERQRPVRAPQFVLDALQLD